MYTILLRPIVNEKSMSLIAKNFYTFEVDKRATKEQISRVVAKKFSVDVLTVRTINLPGKTKMQRGKRATFRQTGVKKALVLLKKGQKIALFEAPKEEVGPSTGAQDTGEVVAKEKKSLLRGTKVKIEKQGTGDRGQGTDNKTDKKGDK